MTSSARRATNRTNFEPMSLNANCVSDMTTSDPEGRAYLCSPHTVLPNWEQHQRKRIGVVTRWDGFYMVPSATTINENGKHWQYAVPRRVVQRSSTLLVLESPRMSLTRDALWHNGR
jgi:hypothetical protein